MAGSSCASLSFLSLLLWFAVRPCTLLAANATPTAAEPCQRGRLARHAVSATCAHAREAAAGTGRPHQQSVARLLTRPLVSGGRQAHHPATEDGHGWSVPPRGDGYRPA